MNESKQEPEVPSNETSGKEISNHEKMLESKVPQGIEESLGFSSVSTDLTDARQIVLFTLETLGEPGNPACDLLASALKVLNKALHTINEEVFSMAVQEPSDVLGCEGVVTQSPSDTPDTQETHSVQDSVVTKSQCNAVTTQETTNAVDGIESPCDAVATLETPNIVDRVVTESLCDAGATQETPHVVDSVVTESPPCDAVATQETLNTVDGMVTGSPCDTVATQETPDVVDVVVSEFPCDAVATQETPNVVDDVVSESPCDAVATQETSNVVDCVVTESACDVLATKEIPDVADGIIIESSCDAVATQETPEVVDDVVTEPPCDVVCEGSEIIASSRNVNVVSEPLVRVQALSEQNIKLPVETGSSMFVHEPAESLTEDWKSNIIASGINTSIHNVSAAFGVGESTEVKESFSNNSLRSRKRRCFSNNSIESCKHSSRNCSKIWEPLRKSRRLSENTASLCQRAEAIATYGTTAIVASLNEKSVVIESLCDAVASQEIRNFVDGVVNESPCDAVATQETPDAEDVVVTESLCDAVSEEVEGSFSNKSLRSRKQRSSSDNSIESCAHQSRNCSDILEPLRKSRRLADNTACLCQRESSEPDEVNATDETMASPDENMTLTVEKLPSLAPRELTEGVAGGETTAINKSEITTSTCNVAATSELATAEETYFEHDGAVPMKKRSYLDLRELTAGVDEHDATVIDASELTASSCNVAAASELATAEETYSEHDGTVPMKKRSYLDLRELTAGVDEDNTTVIDASEITASSCNLTVASVLATAERNLSGINITLPLEKCSALDAHESSEVLRTEESTNVYESEITASSHNVITGQDLFIAADENFEGNTSLSVDKVSLVDEADHAEAIAADGTTSNDDIEITASVNDVSLDPQGFFGDDGSAEGVTLSLEKVCSLNVLTSAEATATDGTPVTDESEVIHGFIAPSEVLMEGEKPSEAYVTLPVEKLSLLEVHGQVEVVATGETANLDDVETTACAYDGSVITAEKGLSEDITLPVEDIASPEVHRPAKAVTTDETTNLDDNKIAESTIDGALAVQEHFQDKTTLLAEKVSSLDVHEPVNAVATKETTTSHDNNQNQS